MKNTIGTVVVVVLLDVVLTVLCVVYQIILSHQRSCPARHKISAHFVSDKSSTFDIIHYNMHK